MADPRLKQIRIKTGVVNRIAKEKQSYETETETEKNRLLKFKENGKSLKCVQFCRKDQYLYNISMVVCFTSLFLQWTYHIFNIKIYYHFQEGIAIS